MTSGYDFRQRKGDPLVCSFNALPPYGPQFIGGKSPRKSESVTSFRSSVSGTPLEPRQVDLYGGFFQRTSPADYFRPGPRLLANLEASGLAQDSDYTSLYGEGIDNGHPFEAFSHKCNTSLRRSVRYTADNAPGSVCEGNPITVHQMTVKSGPDARMPFKFGGNGSADPRTFNMTYEIPKPTTDRLKSDGTQLLTQLTPASPQVSVTAALLELALGMPAIPLASLNVLSKSDWGSEYLNAVFGIMPTYDDAVKIAHTLRDISLKLHQIRRDEGRRVRRKGKLPVAMKAEIFEDSDIQAATVTAGYPFLGTRWSFNTPATTTLQNVWRNGGPSSATYPATRQLFMTETRWMDFSGSFTYVLPEIPGFSGRLEKYLASMDALLGLSMSARIAWQIQPWSWLIDWFLDVRQNIAAIQTGHDDNHVVNYAYAMETVERRAVAKVQFTGASPMIGASYVSSYMTATLKRRIRANPYGFVSESDSGAWGPYRLAILAALGLSRA